MSSVFGLFDNENPLIEANGGELGQGNQFSLVLATVTSINDEEKWNRVKCLPIGEDNDKETDWCYVMTPMGGENRGLFLFPQVGDLVVLGYLRNDINSPIVLGGYWNSETQAPLTVENDKSEDYCLKTKNNVDISIHDEDSKQKLTVTMPSGAKMEIDDENQKAVTQDKDGNTALTMDLKGGEIEIKASSKITLTAGNSTVTLEKDGKITIKGTDSITLDGKSVTVKAQGQLDIQGMDVTVKANNNLNMSASANTSVKGTLLKLN